jgi:hypothetical protein
VREAEYNNASEAVGKLPQLANTPRRWLKGSKLTPEGRQGFINAANALYSQKKQDYDKAVGMYREQANAYGIDPSLVLRQFEVEESANDSRPPLTSPKYWSP